MGLDADDLDAFFDPDMPGYAEAQFASGDPVAGLFRNSYSSALSVGGSLPDFRCPAAAVATVESGAAVTIGGVNYTVASPVETDGGGIAVLRLRDA